MKATKQGSTQGRKRSAERQPAAAASTKARPRRAGSRDDKAPASEAQLPKGGASSDGQRAAPKRARAAHASDGAKSARPTSPRRARVSNGSGAEPARRRPRAVKSDVAPSDKALEMKEALADVTSVGTLRADAPPALDAAGAVMPAADTSVGGSPLVDSFASPPDTMIAPATRSLGARVLQSALAVPTRLLQRVGESVDKVRKAYGERIGQPLHDGVRTLQRLTGRAG